MKKFLLAVTVICLAAAVVCLCGCAACSRENMYTASSEEVKQLPQKAEIEPITEKPVFEPETEVEVEEQPVELPPLPMTADFEALKEISSESVLWGPGVHKDEQGRSTACVGLQEKYGKYDAFFIAPAETNSITLSFDQGYENGYTAPILDALKEKEVKAIFFLTGHYVRTQPELVQRMIDEGHILGSHSDAHAVYCKDLTPEQSFEDAMWMQQHLRDNFDYEMRLFRFPEGEFSEQSLSLMQQLGYKSVFWSFAYNDWNVNAQPDPKEAIEKITSFLHPGEIMLLHSVSSTNAEILPEIIDIIVEKGYELTPFVEIQDDNQPDEPVDITFGKTEN